MVGTGRPLHVAVIALLTCMPLDSTSLARTQSEQLDPVGIWVCVAYANRVLEDERFALHLAPTGEASWARQYQARMGRWSAISAWVVENGRLTFAEAAGGRRFAADLKRETLGGDWISPSATGGWWCVRRMDAHEAAAQGWQASAGQFFVAPLVPDVSASPTYPREAVRAAKQGRAVACFLVDPAGTIVAPELLEISDEVFRYPTIAALYASRYYPWGTVMRPGCRSYVYELDAVH